MRSLVPVRSAASMRAMRANLPDSISQPWARLPLPALPLSNTPGRKNCPHPCMTPYHMTQYQMLHCVIFLYLHYIAVDYIALRHITYVISYHMTLRWSTLQYMTVQHNMVQYSTVWNTTEHNMQYTSAHNQLHVNDTQYVDVAECNLICESCGSCTQYSYHKTP